MNGGAKPILPGGTIGVLGGGQLGRMLAQAATRLGYRVHIYEPQKESPAGAVAHREFNAPYEDVEAMAAFARECDVITYEFENVPVVPLKAIEAIAPLRPHWSVLEICQNRSREKNWLRSNNFPHAAFAEVKGGELELAAAIKQVGLPCVIKTADFGYDGKGQMKLMEESEIAAAASRFSEQAVVIEQFVDFVCEISVVVARSAKAAVRVFPIAENIHTNHILEFSIVPARIPAETRAAADKMARFIAEKIDLVGVMGVEMFVRRDGSVLVNELAPRTHNSGHYTIDACVTSQFEQQVRAICGLPLGAVEMTAQAVAMVNILGDAWSRGEPNWDTILAQPQVKLHLYGKSEPRPGRKMGHFTVTARDADMAFELAQKYQARL